MRRKYIYIYIYNAYYSYIVYIYVCVNTDKKISSIFRLIGFNIE